MTTQHPIQAILFDLDGTLLRAQMRDFVPQYLSGLSAYFADQVKPDQFIAELLTTIRGLIHHEGDGSMTNEERVYASMLHNFAISETAMRSSLGHFRLNGLETLREWIHPIPLAQEIISRCQKTSIPLVLATNPVFPRFVIQARMRWANLDENAFTYVTSYENSYYCKPQAKYFRGISDHLQISPENCLMVGNDLSHDLAAVAVGMQTYLVDTWLVDRKEAEWPCADRGDHSSLQQFLQQRLGC